MTMRGVVPVVEALAMDRLSRGLRGVEGVGGG